jgi:hypothetical protein
MKKLVILAMMMALPATSAQALSIRNLSGEMQRLTLTQGGNSQELVLPAGDTRYFVGNGMTLTLPGQPSVNAGYEDDYVIWPDGQIILQKTQKAKSSAN